MKLGYFQGEIFAVAVAVVVVVVVVGEKPSFVVATMKYVL